MPTTCLGNLLPSSVLAYDNIDLLPNGFIPTIGTTARPKNRNQEGSIISEKEVINLLPADRIYAEFWYGVSSRVTGTNLGDLGGGSFDALGFLGGGAGAGIGGALSCSLQGDSEQVKSRWVFHVADAESRINNEIILTKENIKTGIISLPDYVIAVLGVTRNPIVFASTDVTLTKEQIAKAKEMTAKEVESILGKRISPNNLTDSDIRKLLGIQDFNELDNLGNSQRSIKGWPQTQDGQIQAEFKNYKYSDKENLFVKIIRDSRKNYYRADNEYDRNNGHCFWNGSTDDLTDKSINFKLKEENNSVLLKEGEKVYISYSAAIDPIFRHATENKTNFFLFPDQSVYQLPPLDYVKGWNFKKFRFSVRKKETERCSLLDISHDDLIYKQISEIQNSSISLAEKTKQISILQQKTLLISIECQRLIESKLEKSQRSPFIKGCYFADSRGILSVDFRANGQPVLLIPRSSIRDQSWFDALLLDLQQNTIVFDSNGELILNRADESFFDDFLFDISDHVNMSTYDNEKFGYERRLANAISKCSIYVEENTKSGVGFPNLDFIKNKTLGRNSYDLTSAKFDSVPMQGSSNVFSCNISFVYDFGFCTKGTISAQMLLRTPIFFDKLSKKSRIYVEKFQAQNPLKGDGAIWAGTKPSSSDNYSVSTDPKNYCGYLVYPNSNNGTTNFRIFKNSIVNKESYSLKLQDPKVEGHTLLPIDSTLTEDAIKNGGYDSILGDQPGYFAGTEITTEKAFMLLNKVSYSIIKKDKLTFTKDNSTGRLNVVGLPNRRLKKITITYVPISFNFVSQEKLISFIFPNSKTVIDNIEIPYEGKFRIIPKTFYVDTKYVSLENWFIDGNVLRQINIISIEAESIDETEYQKYKISTNSVSTCFDSSGNWFVFYEDEKGGEGNLSDGGTIEKFADGSHLVGISELGEMTGLQEKSDKEISCLLSPDYGITWYDFKGIVRTVVGDSISNPYVVSDKLSKNMHLFYVLNDMLMHKIISPNSLDPKDAFLAYKRPNVLNAKTDKGYGLYHFSAKGRVMRESHSSVVVGNLSSTYLKNEYNIISDMKKINRNDFRILVSGDNVDYKNGFSEIDFFPYKDSTGNLVVIFIYDSKMYCRSSSDNGDSWFDVFEEGILIHKNSNSQDLKPIKNLGMSIDLKLEMAYLTYQVDGMLFIRKFKSKISKDTFILDNDFSKSTFIVGNVSTELKNAFVNKETPIIFPYKDIDVFGEGFSILEVPSLGYSLSNGLLRFFYKDSEGNFRAFSYTETPILDINYGKGK